MSVTLHLGYVPLLDAAPLLIADALGFAEEEGLHLDMTPAPSWATLRDLLALEQVEAAQMLAPLPIAMALGLAPCTVQFEALSVLNLNGNVIGISNPLADRLAAAGHGFDFADAAAAGRALLAAGGGVRFGVPFAFSMHRELVSYWLKALGAVPAQIDIRTVPPQRMAMALAAGEIDAFCVGEPWGSVAVDSGVATLLLPGAAIWASAPEKVLACRQGWAESRPEVAGALLRALWRAARWLGDDGNAAMASEVLAHESRLGLPADVLERGLTGRMVVRPGGHEHHAPRFIAFFAGAAGFPWRSQAMWMGDTLARRHGLEIKAARTTAAGVFRSDLYRQHLRGTGADLPGASEKLEGAMDQPTAVAAERGQLILPRDRFFDARIFDPQVATR